MRENCRRTGHPNAARDIAADMVELVRQGEEKAAELAEQAEVAHVGSAT
jgi:hypothetical protein